MTREQFVTVLAGIKGAGLVWDNDIAWFEGATVGVQWEGGWATVWGFGWSEDVSDPDQLALLIKKALAQ